MKFTVLFKYCDEVKEHFEPHLGTICKDGIAILDLKEIDIVNKHTGEFVHKSYALLCKASPLLYLKDVFLYGKHATHLIGWRY